MTPVTCRFSQPKRRKAKPLPPRSSGSPQIGSLKFRAEGPRENRPDLPGDLRGAALARRALAVT